MTNHGAVLEYRRWSEDTRSWTPTEGRIKADHAVAELEHELAGAAYALILAVEEKLEQEHRAIAAEAALERVRLKLLFVEEWFDNILPSDWDMCMRRWEDR